MNSLRDASMVNVNPRTELNGGIINMMIINMRIPLTSPYTVFWSKRWENLKIVNIKSLYNGIWDDEKEGDFSRVKRLLVSPRIQRISIPTRIWEVREFVFSCDYTWDQIGDFISRLL